MVWRKQPVMLRISPSASERLCPRRNHDVSPSTKTLHASGARNGTMIREEVTGLLKAAAVNWVRDYAQSMGAALAFYTMFSIAPLLLIVSSIAGFVFGEGPARAEIFYQLQDILGTTGALEVQGLLESARKPTGSLLAVVVGSV